MTLIKTKSHTKLPAHFVKPQAANKSIILLKFVSYRFHNKATVVITLLGLLAPVGNAQTFIEIHFVIRLPKQILGKYITIVPQTSNVTGVIDS